MENSGPLILDISSDEESGFGEPRKDCCYGVGEFGDGEDCEWLSRLLVEVGGRKDDDSDEVVVVSEVLANPPKRQKIESLKPTTEVVCEEVDDDDDDCVVLDGDPDKPVAVVNDKADDGGDDSDDLEIVGEKGEVACRDFPHARHLCAKFVFASTGHELHCSQCHCYVCDSLAPCPFWGTGISSIDHCHANDKEEYWKAERKRSKKGDKPPSVVSSINHTPRIDTFFTPRVTALAAPQPNSLPQSHGSSAVRVHPCHMSSNVSGKNVVNQGRVLPSGCVPRYKPPPQFALPRSHQAHNNNVALRAKQSFPPPPVYNRHGSHRASQNNRHAYGPELPRDPSLRRSQAFQTPAIIGRHGPNQLNIGSRPTHSILPMQNNTASQHHVHPQTYSSCLSRAPMHAAPQISSQPRANSSFANAVPLQPQVGQPNVENFEDLIFPEFDVAFQDSSSLPSQPVASRHTDAGNSIGSQLHSKPIYTSNSENGPYLDNQSSRAQGHNGHASLFMDGHIGIQQENHTQNSVGTSSTDFGFTWESIPSYGNLQIHAEGSQCLSAAPADNSQLQRSTAPVGNFNQQNVVVADNSSVINDNFCHFPESTRHDSLDFRFDDLMFDNQTPPAFEVPASPVWNVFSPEPASIDTGTLFDI